MIKETKDIQQLRLNLRMLIDKLGKLSYSLRLIKGEFRNEKINDSSGPSASVCNIF